MTVTVTYSPFLIVDAAMQRDITANLELFLTILDKSHKNQNKKGSDDGAWKGLRQVKRRKRNTDPVDMGDDISNGFNYSLGQRSKAEPQQGASSLAQQATATDAQQGILQQTPVSGPETIPSASQQLSGEVRHSLHKPFPIRSLAAVPNPMQLTRVEVTPPFPIWNLATIPTPLQLAPPFPVGNLATIPTPLQLTSPGVGLAGVTAVVFLPTWHQL